MERERIEGFLAQVRAHCVSGLKADRQKCRAVKHAGQTTLYLTPMHAAARKLLALITNIRAALSHVRAVAEQLPNIDRWRTFLKYVVAQITQPLPPWLRPKKLAG